MQWQVCNSRNRAVTCRKQHQLPFRGVLPSGQTAHPPSVRPPAHSNRMSKGTSQNTNAITMLSPHHTYNYNIVPFYRSQHNRLKCMRNNQTPLPSHLKGSLVCSHNPESGPWTDSGIRGPLPSHKVWNFYSCPSKFQYSFINL